MAVAITDTGNIHGCHELYKYAKDAGIKPILWTEIFLESSLQNKMYHKIVLLAKSYEGYKNIISLVSHANLERPGNTPYITFEELKNFSHDIICLSWPISGEISYGILLWLPEEKIIEIIERYKWVFWEDFYVELLYHDDIPKQKLVTDTLIELHKKYHFPVVATNDCYYIEKWDKKTQDIIMALGTGHTIENPDRPSKIHGDYSFLSSQEMEQLFGFLPEALLNTVKIAEKIDIKIKTWDILIPVFELPEEDQKIYESAMRDEAELTEIKKLTSDEWYLRYLSFVWLNTRFWTRFSQEEIFHLVRKLDVPGLQKKLTETTPEELREISLTYYSENKKKFLHTLSEDLIAKIDRLEYELEVVHEMWFDAYFLIVADYINWAKKHDIPVGPGRWSAAWSLMAYLTWITDVDPLPYGLLFERFLNPARVSMPDIDTDFADDGRDRVIEYCRNKYGADHVAQICTFGTFAARAAVKDVGRVMGVEFQEMNNFAKLIPEKPGTKLATALEEGLEFKQAYESNPLYKEIVDNALKIEGNVRQIWVHACAVIIAPHPMTHYTALSHPPKDGNAIITQYSAYPLEDLGLLKMDFLWLKNLTVIQRALKIIKNNKWVDLDILKIPLDDQKVFDIFSAWDTTWVFQFESDGMRKYLMDLKPNTFEDLIAMVSLYRPGPLAYIPDFIERKHGAQEVRYMTDPLIEKLQKAWYKKDEIEEEKKKLLEDLPEILDVSYGIAVYQEQLMFIVQSMGGFSLWEADLLRRWVWKKKKEIIEQLKVEFIKRAGVYRWYKPETPEFIYTEMIEPAANYSFNKSHAACYALIAYQTAYLKAYYKTEFMTSLMVSDEENIDRIAMEVWECALYKINILPPSVNASMKHFTYIDDSTIRFGLKAIKGVWDGPIEAIKNGRKEEKYLSLEDFLSKAGKDALNRKSLESLILAGAFDEFGERGELYKNLDTILKFAKNKDKKKQSNQIGLFEHIWEEEGLVFETVAPFTFEEVLSYEKEVLWLSVSGHPLDGLSPYIRKRSQNTQLLKMSFEEIAKLPQKEIEKPNIVQTIGYVKDLRKMMTKSGWMMMILFLEWFDYDFEVTIFPKDFEKYQQEDFLNKIVIVSWMLKVNPDYKRKTILVRDIKNYTITQVREQAKSHNLFDAVPYNIFKKLSQNTVSQTHQEEKKEENNTLEVGEENNEDAEVELTTYIWWNQVTEYTIHIPAVTKKEYLNILKDFLQKLPKGEVSVFLDFKWQKIDTKISVQNLEKIQDFEKKYFK